MFDRLKRMAQAALHDRRCRPILMTPPIRPTDDRLVLFSMIGTSVVLPYLVAVKSLHARLGRGRIAILDDGTLTAADRALLDGQLGNPEIRSIHDVAPGACPRGGCWERLLTLVELAADDYLVQLDSDTVTLGDVPEIAAAIADRRSFTLAGGPEDAARGILPLPAFVAMLYPNGARHGHVQSAIEARFADYPNAAEHRYARGSAGFAGFAPGSVTREDAEAFSRHCAALVGDLRWSEWGTEQVASNFLVANTPGAAVLPYARYMNFWSEAWADDTRFVHFVGTHRYSGNAYARATDAAIAALSAPARSR